MRLSLRCVLAAMSVSASAFVLSNKPHLQAQSCCPSNTCTTAPPACPTPTCVYGGGCNYFWACNSPIIIDVKDEGFHLADAAHGVSFQFYGNTKQHVARTDPDYSNAWLALDRNGNGVIDNASELFGNDTPQPKSSDPNGFAALAVYDTPENGGNNDGLISPADSIYSKLLLWTDRNHNGISEASELQTLPQAGMTSISLYYHLDRRMDKFGNLFRFSGHLAMQSQEYDHHVYDVFLTATN